MAATRPTNYAIPFALNGTKNTIPDGNTGNGKASFNQGFPPVTMIPLTSGGIPPEGKDFNGVLNAIMGHTVWQNAGGQYLFDAALATAIGGYSIGMVLQSNDGLSAYISIQNNNTTNFNTTPASIGTHWMPYGGNALAGIARIVRTSNTIIGAANRATFIDVTSGTFTQTFSTLGADFYLWYRNSGSGVITLDPPGTINGAATLIMPPGTQCLLMTDGTNWFTPSNSVSMNGGTMTGPLILSADPVTALGAVTKQYVDTNLSGTPVLLASWDYTTNVSSFTLSLGSWQATYQCLFLIFDFTVNSNTWASLWFNSTTNQLANISTQTGTKPGSANSTSENTNHFLLDVNSTDTRISGQGYIYNVSAGPLSCNTSAVGKGTAAMSMTSAGSARASATATSITFGSEGTATYLAGKVRIWGLK